jgi:magnesium transporter
VKLFWGKDYIITLERKRWHVSQLFNEYSERDDNSLAKELATSDILLYRIIEKLMKESLYLLKKIGFELEMLNKELFGSKQVRIIERISITRKNIITINTIFKPQLRMFHSFETGQIRGYGDVEFMEDYWGNILDYYQKVWDMTEDHEDLIEGLSKTFDSMQTNKTNEIMKMLTLLSSIILPLTFITGLFGMNVAFPFITSTKVAFWIIIGVMLVVSVALIYFFKHRKWWQ